MGDSEGAWIFLSHSTKDWDEIRLIRNLLEEKGHRPLVFFLKCLREHAELDELIKREIEARTWFLLCDSDNARSSSWVQSEVAYIKTLPDKYHEEIDLNASIETQVERIDRLCRRLTVFISYTRHDERDARRIREALLQHEYNVWSEKDIGPNTLWDQEITNAIDRAVERGFVLVLLSTKSVQSQFVVREVQNALDKAATRARGANIVPIMLEDPAVIQNAMPASLQFALHGIQWFDFSRGDFETDVSRLVASLKSRPMD